MSEKNYATLHQADPILGSQFQYGNMQVTRKDIDPNSRSCRSLISIYESYKEAGILPQNTGLVGDYLEHELLKRGEDGGALAGRYLGIVLPDGDYQYVRLDGESIGIDRRSPLVCDEIDIITDTCLFCAANATATMETGKTVSIVSPKTRIEAPIETIWVSEQMCLYEMDAVIRLSRVIQSLSEGNSAYRRVFIAMPTVEYYFYLMDAYNNGFVATRIMREWISSVNLHAERIIKALSKRIDLDIRLCQPLDSVRGYVEDCVDKGVPADFDRVKSVLAHESQLWHAVLNITDPKTWQTLNYTNYAVSVLETSSLQGDSQRLTIDIENPSEQRILRNASKISRKMSLSGSTYRFRAIGIYPHEKVFIRGDFPEPSHSYPRLYYLGPEILGGECFYREVVAANRRVLA